MGLPGEKTHMFLMTEEQCAQVLLLVKQKGPGTEFWEEWVSGCARKKEDHEEDKRSEEEAK